MKHFSYIVLLFAWLALLYSCGKKRDVNFLLQNKEYKLWYIDNDDKDTSVHICLDTLSIKDEESFESFLAEHFNPDKYDLELLNFMKDKKFPEFLYIDKDGYACVLVLDRNIGDFVEKKDSEITGVWEMKNDTVMVLHNSCYLLKKTGTNPDTVLISNLQTESNMKIIDTNFPPDLNKYTDRSLIKEAGIHNGKWGKRIEQSPLLQGYDYKLWRIEGVPRKIYYKHEYQNVYEREVEILHPQYTYFTFRYFDKYGGIANIYLAADKWRFDDVTHSMETWRFDMYRDEADDLVSVNYWHPMEKDTVSFGYSEFILYNHKDTLHLRDVETGEEYRYIAVNLPPKSKWEKSKK